MHGVEQQATENIVYILACAYRHRLRCAGFLRCRLPVSISHTCS